MTGNKIKAAFLLLILTSFIFGTYTNVFAKDPEFTLDIDNLNLQTGTSTNMVLSIVNAKGAKLSEIKGIENFDVMSTNQSTSTQIINGDITFQNNINYVIMPKKEGQFTLQGIVEYKGKTYATNELTLNVTKTANSQQEAVSDLFITTNVSSTDIYLGQKVAMTYDLYSRYNIDIANSGFKDNIEVDGFMMSDVPQDNLKAEYVYLEGKKYAKYEIRQSYLTPIKTGTFTIPEGNYQANVITDDFWGFSRGEPKYLKTESKQLTVKALPGNQPSDFSGLVGKLELKSEYSRTELNYGDSLTLKVTASGSCDLSVLEKITKKGIPGFTVYETGKDVKESIVDGKYSSQKVYEIILVPEKNGELKIDPINISYFDTESGTYKQADIPGTTIKVLGDAPQVQTQAQDQNSGNGVMEKITISQVSYTPKSDGYLTIQLKKNHLFIALIVFIILALLTVLAIFLLKYLKRRDKNLNAMYNQLNRAKDKNEIYSILNNMLKHKFNLSLKANSKDTIKAKLMQYQLADPVLDVMDYMENNQNQAEKSETFLKNKVKEIFKILSKTKNKQ